jgi:hypothetical protein
MQKQFTIIIFLFTIYCCSETNSYDSYGIEDTDKKETYIITEDVKEDDSIVVSKIEEDFFKKVKQYDMENGENRSSGFNKIFKTHKIQPYDLYVEIVTAYKLADDEARKVGVEIKANRDERITEKYYSVLRVKTETEIEKIKTKYDLDNELFLQFQNNFCFCYSGKDDFYCKDGTCILTNGKYWK